MGGIFRQRNICYLKELFKSKEGRGAGRSWHRSHHHTGWKGRVKCFDKHTLETQTPTYMSPVSRERTALSSTPWQLGTKQPLTQYPLVGQQKELEE